MTFGLFIVVAAVICSMWFIKLSKLTKKAEVADKEEKKEDV